MRFALRPDLVALHGTRPAEAAPAVLTLRGEPIDVAAARDVSAGDPRRRGPVYAQEPGGALAVPTGRIFLRLAASCDAAALVAGLHAAGFRVLSPGVPAASTAWVEPAGGRIEDGLAGLAHLATLPDVVSAEPELLREVCRR